MAPLCRRLVRVAVTGVIAVVMVAAPSVQPNAGARGATGSPLCDRFAAPGGNDRAPGTAGRPVRSVGRLARLLRAGQTGCLRAGVYRGDITISGSGITLRNQPGRHALVVGRLWFTRRSRDSSVVGLALDGRNRENLPSPTVNGSGIRFIGDSVFNGHTTICFILGSAEYGRARGTVISGSRIHDCGRLPAGNHDHGIYVAFADDTRIAGNWIYDNADRGIQLYPDAQRTLIERNVITGNGEGVIFSGADGSTSDGNVVENNVIAGSRIRADVEGYWPDPARGRGNVVRHNCIGPRTGPRGGIDRRAGGFQATGNISARPRYANRARGNLRVLAPAACAALLR